MTDRHYLDQTSAHTPDVDTLVETLVKYRKGSSRYDAAMSDLAATSRDAEYAVRQMQAWRETAQAAEARVAELRAALRRARVIAQNLHGMIDLDTWRSTGGDDGQGHYEGDYRAEQIAEEIESWGVLAGDGGGAEFHAEGLDERGIFGGRSYPGGDEGGA